MTIARNGVATLHAIFISSAKYIRDGDRSPDCGHSALFTVLGPFNGIMAIGALREGWTGAPAAPVAFMLLAGIFAPIGISMFAALGMIPAMIALIAAHLARHFLHAHAFIPGAVVGGGGGMTVIFKVLACALTSFSLQPRGSRR